jgi:hypothetical protein
MKQPFEELIGTYDKSVRVFSSDIDEEDLVWHRDREDRLLQIVGEMSDWQIQLENQLPQNTIRKPTASKHRWGIYTQRNLPQTYKRKWLCYNRS